MSCHLSLFADDTTCIFYNESVENLSTEIHTFLDRLKIWCENNKMIVNSKKTKAISFTTNVSFESPLIKYGENDIVHVE